ncbi:two-component system osmolarity sensor histidine kinase EnvZ [Parvibaculum sp. MBR-TMA-1.3b-4.2]
MSMTRFIKNMLPRGLYGRSLIIIVAPMVLLQIVVTYMFLERHWQLVTERLSASAVSEIALLLDEYERNPTKERAETLSKEARETLTLSVAFLPGEKLPDRPASSGGLLENSLSANLREKVKRPFWIDTSRYTDYIDIRVAYNGGVMRTLSPASHVYATNSHIFLVWMVGTSFVLVVVAILFLRNQIRPIERLAEAAESFGMGRDVPSFRPRGASEVRRAAEAFLDMRNRIERQIAQRTAMLAGVSHDLRTPLTRMRLELAMMGDDPQIQEMRRDIDEMQRMLDDYLEFARGHRGEATEETDLGELLRETCNDWQRKGCNVTVTVQGDLRVPLRRSAFKRCLANLVGNACKYGDTVWITGFRDMSDPGADIEIVVDDDGPGIPEDQLEEVFRPFYRLDDSRNLDEGGSGLGLAIARDIARGHGGEITLSRSPAGGLRAIVDVPV